jgi:hypothetical protein
MHKRCHFRNTENVRRIQNKIEIRKFTQRRIRAEIAKVRKRNPKYIFLLFYYLDADFLCYCVLVERKYLFPS